MCYAAAALVAALALRPALAQQGGINAAVLLNQKSVQAELKLSDEQSKKAMAEFRKLTTARQAARDLEGEDRLKKIEEQNRECEKAVQEILKPDQAKRFRQILLQEQGIQTFFRPEVVSALGITKEQKEKIQAIQEESRKQVKGLRQPGGDREKIQKKMAELTKAGAEKVVKILTDDQKAKWKEMTGAPFTGEVRFGPPDRLKDQEP
jgi:hypothetical protein